MSSHEQIFSSKSFHLLIHSLSSLSLLHTEPRLGLPTSHIPASSSSSCGSLSHCPLPCYSDLHFQMYSHHVLWKQGFLSSAPTITLLWKNKNNSALKYYFLTPFFLRIFKWMPVIFFSPLMSHVTSDNLKSFPWLELLPRASSHPSTWEKEKGRLVVHHQTPNPSEAHSHTNAHRPGSSALKTEGMKSPHTFLPVKRRKWCLLDRAWLMTKWNKTCEPPSKSLLSGGDQGRNLVKPQLKIFLNFNLFMACGIFIPQSSSEPMPPAVKVPCRESYPLDHQGSH